MAPLIVPAMAFGAAFGVLARAAGMGVAAPLVMSATTFGGSAQFAAASILGAGGQAAAAVAAALTLNARYGPIGVSVADGFEGPRWKRFVRAQMIVDESWAVSRVGDRFDTARLVGAGLLLYVVWNLGTLLGVTLGDLLGDPERLGLDAAFPALFLALVVPLVRSRSAFAAALTGAAIAAVLVPVASPGIPVVAASAAVVLGWWSR